MDMNSVVSFQDLAKPGIPDSYFAYTFGRALTTFTVMASKGKYSWPPRDTFMINLDPIHGVLLHRKELLRSDIVTLLGPMLDRLSRLLGAVYPSGLTKDLLEKPVFDAEIAKLAREFSCLVDCAFLDNLTRHQWCMIGKWIVLSDTRGFDHIEVFTFFQLLQYLPENELKRLPEFHTLLATSCIRSLTDLIDISTHLYTNEANSSLILFSPAHYRTKTNYIECFDDVPITGNQSNYYLWILELIELRLGNSSPEAIRPNMPQITNVDPPTPGYLGLISSFS